MITVVSGYRRSGTSLMMQALHAGGMSCLVEKQQEGFNTEKDGYIPSPGGLWEVGQRFYTSPAFLRLIEDGDCLKVLYDGLASLPRGDYTVLFMQRDEDEINASVARSNAHLRSMGIKENKALLKPFDVFKPYKQEDIDHVLGICDVRSDIKLVKIWFRDLILNPIQIFQSLSLPIDIYKAAAVIQPRYYRSRKENEYRKSGISGQRPESSSNEQPSTQEDEC